MSTPEDLQASFAATVVDEWVRAGLTDAVVAPGSRSTPMLAALAEDGRMRVHVVLDERSAGFVALGLGKVAGRPAPVVTTSGTAAVELHPAVVEAHHAGVPLLAVTADRPGELHRVGAPQTVEQVGLFAATVRFAADPGVPVAATSWSWRSLASRAVAETTGHPCGPGPVHLNLAFREPLLGRAGVLPEGRADGGPWHLLTAAPRPEPPEEVVDLLVSAAGRPGLIVAGTGVGEAALGLAEALRAPLLADPTSGARLPHPLVIAAADALLRTPEMAALRPAYVLRLGRPWASKVLAQWLASLPAGIPQVLVDPIGDWPDPDRRADLIVRADPGLLAAAVTASLVAPGAVTAGRTGGSTAPAPPVAGLSAVPSEDSRRWVERWAFAEADAQGAITRTLDADELSEPAVARCVVDALPEGATLVVSSSMPVRDVEWWSRPRRGLRVLANRGANGIDGVVSTAIGVALGAAGPTVALVGDLAFVYDAGALLGASQRPLQLTVVVVDNDGGGIFSFLPQAGAMPAERFERLWGTPHGLDLCALAGAYGVPSRSVASRAELHEALGAPGPGVSVLVVRSDRAANVTLHARLHDAVGAAIARAGSAPPPA